MGERDEDTVTLMQNGLDLLGTNSFAGINLPTMRYSPVLFAIALFLVSCGSNTSIVQSWRDPDTSVQQGSIKKMLIIALMRDEATRRQTEDELGTQFKGRGVSSYNYLGPLPAELETAPFLERLRTDGIDAIMVMRLVDISKEQTYVPGAYPSYYGSPYGYYGHAYGMYSDPGYVRTDMSYRVESNFYSVQQAKLVWSGVTSSMNPTDLTSTISEIVVAIREKMQREGFLTTPPTP